VLALGRAGPKSVDAVCGLRPRSSRPAQIAGIDRVLESCPPES
jgi:hypothetical protein